MNKKKIKKKGGTTTSSPLFSIITVVYNNSQLLEKTILSVILQTYPSFEFIIIDGGSTDKTIGIIEKYEANISFWVSERDEGIYDAMNKGTKMAKGEWLLFLNAGDLLVEVKTLEMISEKLKKHSYYDVLYGDILVADINGKLCYRSAGEPKNMHRMYFCHQSVFIKHSLMNQFLYDISYKMSADLKFFKLAYLAGYKFIHIHLPVVVYDKTGVSNTKRNQGLYENVRVVKEIDHGLTKLRLLIHLYFTIYWRKILNKR